MTTKITPPRNSALKTRVKTAKRRSASSTKWLQRQLNDPYVTEAKRQGYRSRAAFKLLQLDEQCHLLRKGQRVIDLGAAPGGWTQIVVDVVKPELGKGCVIGLDLLPIEPLQGATFIQGNFLADDAIPQLIEILNGKADLVLSDMAAAATGHRQTDHLKIIALAEIAFDFACEVLEPGGAFVCKILKGGTENELLNLIKKRFAKVKHVKPAASRSDSSENYLVAQGFKG